ncbi:MAG: SpoIIE family protein phosphatase [Eubacterium sp.]
MDLKHLKLLTVSQKIIVTVLCTLLFALFNILLSHFTLINIPYVSIRPQIIIPLLSGYLMGPIFGFIVGFLGNTLSDYICGYGFSFLFNWSIAYGLYGLMMGFFPQKNKKIISNKEFTNSFLFILLVNIVPAIFVFFIRILEPNVNPFDSFFKIGLPIIVSNMLVCALFFPLVLIYIQKIILNFEIKITLLIYYFSLISVLGVSAITIVILSSMNLLNNTINMLSLILYDLSIIPLVLINFIAFGISNNISQKLFKPLITITDTIKKMDGTTYDQKFDIKTGDELELLADAFNEMTDKINSTIIELKNSIDDRERLAAEKERINTELSIAHQIQTAMLPQSFPTFPNRTEFSISGYMTSAKEIGGDFYDFFLIDDTKLVFTIADISGKGIPAALLMMSSKEHIIDQVFSGSSLDAIFTEANHHLYANTAKGMFLTSFLGILDLKSGLLSFVNAGHNPPLLKHKNGSFEHLSIDANFVMAILPNYQYKQQTIKILPDDTLFLFTDGVTEAIDNQGHFFGDYRLQQALNSISNIDNYSSDSIIDQIQKKLADFTQNEIQHDDITMLCLKFHHLID